MRNVPDYNLSQRPFTAAHLTRRYDLAVLNVQDNLDL